MTSTKQIYKIDHYYYIDHDESSFFLETELKEEELIEILATIQFKFEELVDESAYMENESLIQILEKFHPIKHVTDEYKAYLPLTKLEEEDWNLTTYFSVAQPSNGKQPQTELMITQIDLYKARERSCGDKWRQLMAEPLANSKEFIDEILAAKVEQ